MTDGNRNRKINPKMISKYQNMTKKYVTLKFVFAHYS